MAHSRANKRTDAFYLGEDWARVKVKQDERALGWPLVRFEVNFQ